MQYITKYSSPLGNILLAGDEIGLTGLWFEGQKYFASSLNREHGQARLPVLDDAARWLDVYFSGKEPDFDLPLHFAGSVFQNQVWALLRTIPYGKTVTYGALAAAVAKAQGLSHMSAQAVGGAVARNPISIIVPCHRVVGGNGSLTGYAGGLEKKTALLKMEGAWQAGFFAPRRG